MIATFAIIFGIDLIMLAFKLKGYKDPDLSVPPEAPGDEPGGAPLTPPHPGARARPPARSPASVDLTTGEVRHRGGFAPCAPRLASITTAFSDEERIRSPAASPAAGPTYKADMPKRTDIRSILIIGAGPIVIGQACRVRLLRAPRSPADRRTYLDWAIEKNPCPMMRAPALSFDSLARRSASSPPQAFPGAPTRPRCRDDTDWRGQERPGWPEEVRHREARPVVRLLDRRREGGF